MSVKGLNPWQIEFSDSEDPSRFSEESNEQSFNSKLKDRYPKIERSEETSQLLSKQENSNMRVRSWLRMNAGGVPNTCKSNEQRGACSSKLVADG